MNSDQPLTPQEVADILRIAKNTVYELIKRGELKGYRVGNKFRVDYKDVLVYKNNPSPGAVSGPVAQKLGGESNRPDGAFRSVAPSGAGFQASGAASVPQGIEGTSSPGFVLCGQDIILDILAQKLESHPWGGRVYRSYLGSYNGLYALYQGSVQVASAHLWDGATNTYNVPFMPYVLPGVPVVMIHLACRTVGYYVPAGNPQGLKGWGDLGRADLILANRERGSGMRVLLDEKLRLAGIATTQVPGYGRIYPTHLAAASAVARGGCSYALGSEKAARQVNGIDFIPLQEERYELVFQKDDLEKPMFKALMEIVQSRDYQDEVASLGGYNLSETGRILS